MKNENEKLTAALSLVKNAKEREQIAETFIFKRTSMGIDTKSELRDQLSKANELM